MQSQKSAVHISTLEWRWVFILGGALTALTLLPYAWALAANATATDWQFMGILANPLDGATYLAKIGQGYRGAWLMHFMHTPEPHSGAAIFIFYLFLGHFARLIGVSNLVVYHMARVVTTLFMYSALYHFGATVWTRLRPRRLFFALIAVGSGLGWLALLFGVSASEIPDFAVPEAYPLYSAYTNPHFPLVIGCLALIAATYIRVFRIDFTETPDFANGGFELVILTIVVALALPQALIPLGISLAAYLVVRIVFIRKLPLKAIRWSLMFAVPAVVMAAFYLAVLTNPVMESWNSQIETVTTSPLLVILGYGFLLFTALPGLVRAVRRFEEDGDQLMLIWLVVNTVLVFLPFNHQRRFMTGFIIPITFFAVRSLEDYWLQLVQQERWRYVALIALMVAVMISNILAIGLPLFGLVNPDAGLGLRLMVERGYWDAMLWLDDNGKPEDVVLSSPNIGLWIPAWGQKRVVYGHPFETLDAETKLIQVEQWYQGQGCDALLDQYFVRYVIVGPQERSLSAEAGGTDSCYQNLAEVSARVVEFDDVMLYELAN